MQDKEKEFELLTYQYGGIISKVCFFYSSDAEHYKDLRQEVLANLWKGFDGFRGSAKVSTWIYRVSLNSCISFHRKHERNMNVTSIDEMTELVDPTVDRPELLREMYRLINLLGKIEKAVILLWLDERSYDEISEVTGLPRNTVASKLHRIKDKLTRLANE